MIRRALIGNDNIKNAEYNGICLKGDRLAEQILKDKLFPNLGTNLNPQLQNSEER